eukprot:CAMPEP_0204122672 /NCGR_PEP_ID=MMETSP0361-20130328/8853_1 /ASSEMBLY_ACC=CAM_ASM_000343 /TAXON_ID=268821 /ORGANISM="Scrippsiella Hangoei, Strain SHTV-5" /LENGTH=335 /DNA_ID=CAMNT_0051074027 /DNA_START=202 /DNA_END=1212 /DNA_ORIENTATION=-
MSRCGHNSSEWPPRRGLTVNSVSPAWAVTSPSVEGPMLRGRIIAMPRHRQSHELVVHHAQVAVRKTGDAKVLGQAAQNLDWTEFALALILGHNVLEVDDVGGEPHPLGVLLEALAHADDHRREHGCQGLEVRAAHLRRPLMGLHQQVRAGIQAPLELFPSELPHPVGVASLVRLPEEQAHGIEDPCRCSSTHVAAGSDDNAWLPGVAKAEPSTKRDRSTTSKWRASHSSWQRGPVTSEPPPWQSKGPLALGSTPPVEGMSLSSSRWRFGGALHATSLPTSSCPAAPALPAGCMAMAKADRPKADQPKADQPEAEDPEADDPEEDQPEAEHPEAAR